MVVEDDTARAEATEEGLHGLVMRTVRSQISAKSRTRGTMSGFITFKLAESLY
jgi:hypothetical protein